MPERTSLLRQASLPGLSATETALKELSQAGAEERGAVFTRREVVEFILDLVRYVPEQPLHESRILEPSFGAGDFLLVIVERLLKAWRQHATSHRAFDDLKDCIRAVELHQASFEATRERMMALLAGEGITPKHAVRLVDHWLIQGDFLLEELPTGFDIVVGNPPYVRQEQVPDALMAEYRALYATIFDRADLYVPFIERSLNLLSEGGSLGFICADRWMKNRYGKHLRHKVAEHFSLRAYVDMVGTPAFHDNVTAYPAITIIDKQKPGQTRIAYRPEISRQALDALARDILSPTPPGPDSPVKQLANVAVGTEPWLLESSGEIDLVRRIERDFPAIEDAGCKVGIGVATGADSAFVAPYETLNVEPDRKLPLATTRDVSNGEVQWRGLGVINPFTDEGGLVDLERYPRLKNYLHAHKKQIAGRHIAQKAPNNWYRTIDRIYPEIAGKPKLLIPDIKGDAQIVYEDGHLYPHHNLYFITSDEWDMKALMAVLRSGIARLFVAAYSTQMRGGYLRFQAQYLRRIRLPRWQDVPPRIKATLRASAERDDPAAGNAATFKLYGLSREEQMVLNGNGETRKSTRS